MTKKIAVIHDLSGFGRCSLTAAISVISAMGVQPCPLPTAILTAQTGYPSYYCDDYTDKMDIFRREWEKLGARFDGIYTGFLAGEKQIGKVFGFLDTFYMEDKFLLVDPVMGDNGARFDIFSDEFQSRMKELVFRADIVTPNLTELCLLAGEDCRRAGADVSGDREKIIKEAASMARELISRGPEEVIVTGIRFTDEESGTACMGNLIVTEKNSVLSARPFVGESFSGTGDLFASAVAGGKARGDALEDTVKIAGEMIEKAMRSSVENKVPRNDGADYEQFLWMLTRRN